MDLDGGSYRFHSYVIIALGDRRPDPSDCACVAQVDGGAPERHPSLREKGVYLIEEGKSGN